MSYSKVITIFLEFMRPKPIINESIRSLEHVFIKNTLTIFLIPFTLHFILNS